MPEAKGLGHIQATVSAKVTRADGTVEDLGEIANAGADDASVVVKLLRSIAAKVRR